eukprot:307497-Pleurochrysis_carterae.AAC.2
MMHSRTPSHSTVTAHLLIRTVLLECGFRTAADQCFELPAQIGLPVIKFVPGIKSMKVHITTPPLSAFFAWASTIWG